MCVTSAGQYYYIVDHKGLDNGRPNRSVRLPKLREFAQQGEHSLCFGASVQYEPLRGNDPDVWVPITRVRLPFSWTTLFDCCIQSFDCTFRASASLYSYFSLSFLSRRLREMDIRI